MATSIMKNPNQVLAWRYVDEKTGTTSIALPELFNEVLLIAKWGRNTQLTVSTIFAYNELSGNYLRRLLGNYAASNDYHNVQIDCYKTQAHIVCWKSNSGDQTSTSKLQAYVR